MLEGIRVPSATHSTKPYRGVTDDWITPRSIIDALGHFDLDPCACIPQPWPTAEAMWTRNDDGLSRDWFGSVWLNPPYGPDAEKWISRLAKHGNGVALIFARTETRWFFDTVWSHADAVMFIKGRLHFHYPDGTRAKGNAGGPNVLAAYGYDAVARLFGSGIEGAIVTKWSAAPTQRSKDDED